MDRNYFKPRYACVIVGACACVCVRRPSTGKNCTLFFCILLFFSRYSLFPTSLCGVLVSDSVSRSSRPRRLLTHLCHTHHRRSHTHTHLSHTTLSHTLFHRPSFTHNFVTHHLSHTSFVTQLCCGVALGDIHLRLTWQAWHLATSTFVWRGRR